MPPEPLSRPAARSWRTRLVRASVEHGWRGRTWTSAVLEPGWSGEAAADQAVASWNLDAGATALVELRARTADGVWHPWQLLARWGAPGDRRSAGRADGVTGPVVETDVLTAGDGDRFDAVQLRVSLPEGAPVSRPLRLAAVSFSAPAMAPSDAGRPEDAAPQDTVPGAGALGVAATVTPLSQRAYPERDDLGGGGPSWCSPTSLTMVALGWGAAIPDAAPEEVPDGADPRVPWVARAAYDAAYDGTGNWSFNAAVAGGLGLDAVVTRLSSLRSAQVLTDVGIPLIASISFGPGELAGADYDTAGHLLVIRGFDAAGDVLVADPANPGGAAGLRTYPRAAFDAAWCHSRRTVYLLTPRGHALPPTAGGEW
ncbi:C39 family peptidase [Leifsonia sp. NPDC080035]|uniref:C39 family peptidase n=1 Tax=Leifsonia sp. NPDC080035 TaxID=3143936 RepID=A0AAU7GE06_9MICO